jgi:hypothetical protein
MAVVGVAWKQLVSLQLWWKMKVDRVERVLFVWQLRRATIVVNYVSVQNGCARTALTDCSSNKQHLRGTIIIQRNFTHIYFCVGAWEVKDRNKSICSLICSTLCLWFNLRKNDKEYWEIITAISSKYTQYCKFCNIYCSVIQCWN